MNVTLLLNVFYGNVKLIFVYYTPCLKILAGFKSGLTIFVDVSSVQSADEAGNEIDLRVIHHEQLISSFHYTPN